VRRALGAGAAYFGLVFAAGVLLGTLRVALLAPALGETAAVALELPAMLGLAWFAARWLVRRWRVAVAPAARLAMGGTGFVLLLAAEAGLGAALGRPAVPATAAGLLGLAGQVAFALLPLAQGLREGEDAGR
jgi:hypothetical protein